MNLITYSFLMMIVSSLGLEKYFLGSFQHSESSLMNILIIFPPHPLWIGEILSPATKRKIQSQLRKYKM